MTQLHTLAGSLAAVLALAGIAWAIRLGHMRIDWNEAIFFAQDKLELDPLDALVGGDGKAALVVDYENKVAAIKLHGARYAGRVLASPVELRESKGGVTVATGDGFFGDLVLRGCTAEQVRAIEERNVRTEE